MTDPQTPGALYAGSGDGLFKSTDNGTTWVSAGLSGLSTRPLAAAPPATVYAAGKASTGISTLYLSPDGGIHWTPMGQGADDLIVDPFSPTTLYRADNFQNQTIPVTYGSRVSRSTDGGASWTEIDSGMGLSGRTILKIAADPGTPGTLYVSGVGGVSRGVTGLLWKTTDSGSSWVLLSSSLGVVPAISVDPTNSSVVYAASEAYAYSQAPGGVYKSVDGGGTFVLSNNGLTSWPAVGALCIDAHRPNRLYVTLDSHGVFASSDAGTTWQAMDTGLPTVNGSVIYVGSLAIDPSGTNLHVATPSGIFDYEIVPDASVLSLDPGRTFSVTLAATDQRTGRTGPGLAMPVSNIFGYFSIPAITDNPGNPEVFVKMLDGTAINGRYWFFYGGLTDLEYTLTVKDNVTGQARTYTKEAGSECGGSDTAAFTP